MTEISDSVAWPSRCPGWVSTMLLMGLIGLIPILGTIVLLGWMLATVDNLRAGRTELPPAGFSYLGRGLALFVVLLVYGLIVGIMFAALFGAGLALVSQNGLAMLGVPLILVAYAVLIAGSLGLAFISPALVLATERGGIAGGLNAAAIIHELGADPQSALRAGLFALVAYIIAQAGTALCLVGVVFTVPYGHAVLASVAYHYERRPAAALGH